MTLTSAVPRGFAPGLLLFNVFINELDAGVECSIGNFVDDTKLGGIIYSIEGQEIGSLKPSSGMLKLDIRKHFFTKSVIKHWNRYLIVVGDAPEPVSV